MGTLLVERPDGGRAHRAEPGCSELSFLQPGPCQASMLHPADAAQAMDYELEAASSPSGGRACSFGARTCFSWPRPLTSARRRASRDGGRPESRRPAAASRGSSRGELTPGRGLRGEERGAAMTAALALPGSAEREEPGGGCKQSRGPRHRNRVAEPCQGPALGMTPENSRRGRKSESEAWAG